MYDLATTGSSITSASGELGSVACALTRHSGQVQPPGIGRRKRGCRGSVLARDSR